MLEGGELLQRLLGNQRGGDGEGSGVGVQVGEVAFAWFGGSSEDDPSLGLLAGPPGPSDGVDEPRPPQLDVVGLSLVGRVVDDDGADREVDAVGEGGSAGQVWQDVVADGLPKGLLEGSPAW